MTPGRPQNARKRFWLMFGTLYFLANVLFLGGTSVITKLAGDELQFVLIIASMCLIGGLGCFLAYRKERRIND